MSHRKFITSLAAFSLLPASIVLLTYLIQEVNLHQDFAWVCIASFIAISYLMFVLATKVAHQANKGLFVSVSMLFNGLKIVLSLSLLTGYYLMFRPENKLFLVPFFMIYLLYTIFEIYFLSKIAK